MFKVLPICLICILQFRLAYVAPESSVVGAGELVDQPKKIALNYLFGYFLLDLFIVLPLPQVSILSHFMDLNFFSLFSLKNY